MKNVSFQCRLVYIYNVLWSSLVSLVYVKQLIGHQRTGDVTACAHHLVIFELFLAEIRVPVAFLTKPGMLRC